MYKIGRKRGCQFILAFFFFSILFFGATTILGAEFLDSERGYEEGYKFGLSVGKFEGEKDSNKERASNWEGAYEKERKYLEEDYDLHNYTMAYRRSFYRGFEVGFEEAYIKAYKKQVEGGKKPDETLGEEHGLLLGSLFGTAAGIRDFFKEKSNQWERDLLSKRQIENKYNLGDETRLYRETFIKNFTKAYEIGYLEGYQKTHFNSDYLSVKDAFSQGIGLGEQAGALWGNRHWQEKKIINWKIALELYEKEIPIMQRYHLGLETPEYQGQFINGFQIGFRDTYIVAFQNQRQVYGTENMNYYWINQKEEEIQLDETIVHFVKGHPVDEIQTIAKLLVPANAFWGKFYLAIAKDIDDLHMYYAPHRRISDSIYIGAPSGGETIQNKKSLHLSFPWYGEDRAGIYEWINHQWRYIYSVMEEDQITAEISLGNDLEGRYMVMVDEDYKEIFDIYGNWAQKELYTFLRRGYIQGNQEGKYEPERAMTRGEFLLLLSKIQQWPLYIQTGYSRSFLDQDTFGEYAAAIQYAGLQGYTVGYQDGTFKPHQEITYQEVEWILRTAFGQLTFQWETIEEELKYTKYIRSKSKLGKNQSIPKGEVIFALYYLEEKNKN